MVYQLYNNAINIVVVYVAKELTFNAHIQNVESDTSHIATWADWNFGGVHRICMAKPYSKQNQ